MEQEPATDARVTVVIATRNRRDELHRTLRNLAGARPPPPVVVVDNGSTDGTADSVRALFPGVALVALDRNAGSAARNIGAALAETPYVAFSDDDSWWAPDALERAADAFDAHPRLGLVAASVHVGDDERPDPINALLARGLGTVPGLPGPRVLGFMACGAVVRVAAFEQVGGFNPMLFFAGEESLLAQDLAAAGWQPCHLPEVRAHHHPSEQRPPASWRRRLEMRNAVLTVWLRRPLGRALAETARLARRAATSAPARGALLDVLRGLPRAIAARHRLPASVERDMRVLEAS
ncbi:glycosyltransferase family 2 protein [Actinorugispora endophytica]|uniref:GT2 family glycosyltransferase n=1 Tax=Actinorugispora endophytica TaxID=1605990 RepID=A0A4R6UZS6_9ACTN|nr:glycosyltransferase [Actinorugispora endophytica]TDQ51533.1 GT2 family glycosyltransferase [Actinorugispora endophytica]